MTDLNRTGKRGKTGDLKGKTGDSKGLVAVSIVSTR